MVKVAYRFGGFLDKLSLCGLMRPITLAFHINLPVNSILSSKFSVYGFVDFEIEGFMKV
jgi:hypothetical protein